MTDMRIDYILSNIGIGSRKEIKGLLTRKQIKVNGKVVCNASFNVSERDNVEFLGRTLCINKYIYLMINKPKGYVCTSGKEANSVLHLVPSEFFRKDLFCVGRLDKDTTGLLLITNDGKFAHNIISPKKHLEKTYSATLLHPIADQDISIFADGVLLSDGEKTLPALLEKTEFENVVIVKIYEGKYHQIKRMFGAVGNKVIDLKRTKIGDYILPKDLSEGEVLIIEKKSQNID